VQTPVPWAETVLRALWPVGPLASSSEDAPGPSLDLASVAAASRRSMTLPDPRPGHDATPAPEKARRVYGGIQTQGESAVLVLGVFGSTL
jgi:hypothetical protein